VPHRFDVDKQVTFIEYYEQLKVNLNDSEPLLIIGEVHPTQATKITAGWIRKGVDKPTKKTGSRSRPNFVGAIRLEHLAEAVIEQYDKTVNGESIVEFLINTRDFYSTSGNIHLVLEGARCHRSRLVTETSKGLDITLHYLPPIVPI
jgi:hypothetical protein